MGDLTTLVEEFAETVMAMKESLRRNDSRRHNRFAAKLGRVWQSVRAHGDDGRRALMRLFGDSRPDVRVMAAAHLLPFCTDEAIRVLEKESEGTGIASFGAAQALDRWKEGDWHLDPE